MVKTFFTIQKEVPVTSNSELVALIKIATLQHVHPVIRTLFVKSIPNVQLSGRLPYFVAAWEKLLSINNFYLLQTGTKSYLQVSNFRRKFQA